MKKVSCVFYGPAQSYADKFSFAVKVFNATEYVQGELLVADTALDFGNLEELCPKWVGDIPLNSYVAVIHTVGLFEGGTGTTNMNQNLIGVVVLALTTMARQYEAKRNANRVYFGLK